jgi:chorismate dehydratase
LILSDVPLEEADELLLDYQSRTSVMLSKVLLENHWKQKIKFVPAKIGYENSIGGKTAGVVIGDRALVLRKKFKYVYDLPLEWKKMTGLPFVFATWTSTIDLSTEFIHAFNKAIEEGMKMIDEISKKEFTPEISQEEVFTYLTKSIDFDFNQQKQEALKLFLKLASQVSDI